MFSARFLFLMRLEGQKVFVTFVFSRYSEPDFPFESNASQVRTVGMREVNRVRNKVQAYF